MASFPFSFHRFAWPFLGWLSFSLCLPVVSATAGNPKVHFDIAQTIECRDAVDAAAADPQFAAVAAKASPTSAGKSQSVLQVAGNNKASEEGNKEPAASQVAAVQVKKTIALKPVAFASDREAARRPTERRIDVTFPISVRNQGGHFGAVEVLIFEITGGKDMRVVAFSPQTELASDVVGVIDQTTTREKSSGLDATLGGNVPVPFGEAVARVTPSVSGQKNNRTITIESTKKLPPLKPLLVSGTMRRGRGVFFKLLKNPQTTLEGTHTVTIRFAVPNTWRMGRLHVACKAKGHEKLLWLKQERIWGTASLPVVVYQSGDEEAKTTAQRLAKQAAKACACKK